MHKTRLSELLCTQRIAYKSSRSQGFQLNSNLAFDGQPLPFGPAGFLTIPFSWFDQNFGAVTKRTAGDRRSLFVGLIDGQRAKVF
jgi:hypothetical protein